MSTTKKRAELKRLAATAQQSIYDMLKLASEILADKNYVDQFGGEAAVIEEMEAKEFAHFGGNPALATMLATYRKIPDQATWKEYHCNVVAMIELANPREPRSAGERIGWKARAVELEAEVASLTAMKQEQSKTIAELRARADELAAELGELRGRLSVAERYLPRRDYAGVG